MGGFIKYINGKVSRNIGFWYEASCVAGPNPLHLS